MNGWFAFLPFAVVDLHLAASENSVKERVMYSTAKNSRRAATDAQWSSGNAPFE